MSDKVAGDEEGGAFRVKDRRRVGREETGEAAPGEQPASPEASRAGDEPEGEAAGEARLPPVPDLIRLFIGELHGRAWMHMGLIVDPATKQAAKDLPQARLAIDCMASLVDRLAPLLEAAERLDLERLLADLRMNYVRQAGP